jgi:16S rRNA (cytidine1402-2'-O)-methyltransferase
LSDPGFDLVRRAIAVNITPIAIPGPSALLTALCTAGIPLNRFIFAGFLSKKPGKRRKELGQLLQFPGAIILYESPYRIVKLLNDLAVLNNELELAICRELTKKFEEIIRGKVTTVLQNLNERKQIKGEFVVIIDNKSNN